MKLCGLKIIFLAVLGLSQVSVQAAEANFALRPLKGHGTLVSRVKGFMHQHILKSSQYELRGHWRLERQQNSLLGQHFYFQQYLNDIPIRSSVVSISVLRDKPMVYRSYKSINTASFGKPTAQGLLNTEQAFDAAWQRLGVMGALFHEPKAKRHYRDVSGQLRLVYEVELGVLEPYGYWHVVLDAESAKIYEISDQRIDLQSKQPARQIIFGKRWIDRSQAFKTWYQKKLQNPARKTLSVSQANGQAFVFDPDPRTVLQDESLQDTSPASAFDAAYRQRQLFDLTVESGVFQLKGPWVHIEDFDPPAAAPSTSLNGAWQDKRGKNSFNDVMTYYHLDKSQRYLQELGFRDDSGVQFKRVRVDSNGANGADNSYYQPSTNTISFGHGCVDDNEDADVILHEYGHAIQFDINSNWYGGDTGAMGEGFGDYWAGSYSLRAEGGESFQVTGVFDWDGRGEGNICWPGRQLDATELRYNPARTYGAHVALPGGRVSDELWSTPLFQALLQLRQQGIAHTDMDKVVIESHFGLGPGLLMPDLARATVQAAELLFPDQSHATVYKNAFVAMGILQLPRVEIKLGVFAYGSGANNHPDPGELVDIRLKAFNTGDLPGQRITAKLMAAGDLTPVIAETDFADIDVGGEAWGQTTLQAKLDDGLACGQKAALKVLLKASDMAQRQISFSLPTGRRLGVEEAQNIVQAIPDNDPQGIVSRITVRESDQRVSENFFIGVDIEHTFIGDLEVSLVSPQGEVFRLHQRSGAQRDHIKARYPTPDKPVDDLSVLVGQKLAGTWQLRVRDLVGLDSGKLLRWVVSDVQGYQCDTVSKPLN